HVAGRGVTPAGARPRRSSLTASRLVRLVRPRGARFLDRLAGLLCLVGDAPLAPGDVAQLLSVFLEGVGAAPLVDHPLRLIGQSPEVDHFGSSYRAVLFTTGFFPTSPAED